MYTMLNGVCGRKGSTEVLGGVVLTSGGHRIELKASLAFTGE